MAKKPLALLRNRWPLSRNSLPYANKNRLDYTQKTLLP